MKSMGHTAAKVALAAGLALSAGGARGALLSWNNAIGGAASTSTNWSPNAVPTAADDLTFAVAGSYAVTFSNLVPSSRTMTYRTGSVTLTMSSPHTTSTGLTIGSLAGDAATTILTTGTWTSGGTVTIGNAASASGTLTVNDDDADLILSGATSDLFVGNNGPGTLNITGGGLVRVPDQFIAGSNSTSTSSVTVSGATSSLPLARSTLEVTGTSQSRLGQGGDATVTISNGALATFAGEVVIANGSASTSTVSISGTGGILPQNATLDVAGNLLVGRNVSGGVLAGQGTLNVDAGGRLLVGGTLFVAGDLDGGSGTLHLGDQGAITTGSLDIGLGATLDLDGGALTIDGGTLAYTNSATPFTIGGAQGPIMTMVNGASATLSTVVSSRALVVGGGSGALTADFDVRSGSDLSIPAGVVIVGEGTDDGGGMIINGAGSTMTLSAASDLIVGLLGQGRFEAELGATVQGGRLFVGQLAGSDGYGLFENPGTTAQFTSVFIGGNATTAGGTGLLAVNDQATLTATTFGTGVRVWPGGELYVRDSAVNASGSFVADGLVDLQNVGQINSPSITFNGLVRAHPDAVGGPASVSGRVALTATGIVRAVNGDITLGDATEALGFAGVIGSTIETGPHTITLLDADRATVGTVILAGGTLAAPNEMEIVTNGNITGTGNLTGGVFFNSGGSVITATTAAGITFNGMLRNDSGSIAGTQFTFNGPAGGWTGAGTINAKAVFNSGTEVNAVANMTMGDGTSLGVTFNLGSELHADNERVTLLDSNGVGLGSLTTLNTGTVACTQQLVLNSGREVHGRGSLETPLFLMNGRVKVGPLPNLSSDIAVLRVNGANGTVMMSATAIYDADLGFDFKGFPAGDQIFATGPLTVAGTLNVGLVPGYVPAASHIITIARGSSRTGTFATTDLPAVGAFGPAHVEYTATSVDVVMCYANCDGSRILPTLNVNDFVCFQNRFAAASSLPPAQQASDYANCDRSTLAPVLNVNDFTCFLNKFAAGCN